MELPKELELQFNRDLDEYEEGLRVPYVTSIERIAMFRVIENTLRTNSAMKPVIWWRPFQICTTPRNTWP